MKILPRTRLFSPHAYALGPICHCERGVAISLGQRSSLRQRDRQVAALLAMANRVRVSCFPLSDT